MFVVRRGKDVITCERADKLKEGDFLFVQLHSESSNAQYSKISKITKQKIATTSMTGIKTASGMYISSFFLVSDKSDNCGSLSIKQKSMIAKPSFWDKLYNKIKDFGFK